MADWEYFGEFITTEYEISRKIFGYLPVTDLHNCKTVCKSWERVVEATLRKRRRIQVVEESAPTTPFIQCDAQFSWSFFRGGKLHKDGYSFDYLTDNHHIFRNTYGVILKLAGASKASRKACMGTVRFPPAADDGVGIVKFQSRGNRTVDVSQLQGKEIKAVFFFANNGCSRDHLPLIDSLREVQPTFPLAGGYLSGRDSSFDAIVFYGPRVHARSCVLTHLMTPRTNLEEHICAFRESCQHTDGNCVLFTFTCIDRVDDAPLFKAEVALLDKYFPHCPRLGFCAGGEIGCDFFQLENSDDHSKRSRVDVIYGISTVLMCLWYD